MDTVLHLLQSGASNLAAYLAAHVLLCLLFGIGIGLLMARLIWRDDAGHDAQTNARFAHQAPIGRAATGLLLSRVAVLLAGTLKIAPLTATIVTVQLPLAWDEAWQATLVHWVLFDAARVGEGVSVQGSPLIVLLILIGLTAWRCLEDIVEGANRGTRIALALAAITLRVATLRLVPPDDGLRVVLTGWLVAVGVALWPRLHFARRLDADACHAWRWESWRFVKQVFPLLLVGVFAVGVIRPLIEPTWIERLAGDNSLRANGVAVLFGAFMYFRHWWKCRWRACSSTSACIRGR